MKLATGALVLPTRSPPMTATIDPAAHIMTLINVFTVAPAHQQELPPIRRMERRSCPFSW